MTTRTATCRCGQLTATCTGEPVRISVCHCLNCQRRSGSAFSAQARWPREAVTLGGEADVWAHRGESGPVTSFRFCPTCGSTLAFENESLPGTIAVALGAFADPGFPAPAFSVYEERQHAWVQITGDVERHF